ncbi:hypothetical protein GT646_20070 [Clostridium butyricum]|nr:hypothetical protein [Clostridium butyricum]
MYYIREVFFILKEYVKTTRIYVYILQLTIDSLELSIKVKILAEFLKLYAE